MKMDARTLTNSGTGSEMAILVLLPYLVDNGDIPVVPKVR